MSISASMELDKNLKKLMSVRNVTLAQLAKEVGIAKSTIHGWINGAHPRSVPELNKIATYFGLNIHELCFGSEKEKGPIKSEEVIARFGGIDLVLRRSKE
jgi:transcriptional regulator with XRE-family HTH domain